MTARPADSACKCKEWPCPCACHRGPVRHLVYLCQDCADLLGCGNHSLTVGVSARWCDGGCGTRIGWATGPADSQGVARLYKVSEHVIHWPKDVWPIGLGMTIREFTSRA